MFKGNRSAFSGFTLLGYSKLSDLQGLLFALFLSIYAGIILGNGMIIYVTVTDPALDTPMYFFLKSLSFLEISYTSVTIPKILVNLVVEDQTITFIGCAIQLYFMLLLGGTECLLLAAMAYDRYVAICHPLHYKVIMNRKLCFGFLFLSLAINVLMHVGQVYFLFTLPFCDSHEIDNLFCDIPPLLDLACADIHKSQLFVFAAATLFLVIPFCLIFASYVKIISAILKMPSVNGRKKVFSTCSSHLTVISLFYGSAIIVYLSPRSNDTVEINKLFSLFYIILVPMFNPIIYSLRNKEVKVSLGKLFSRKMVL
nr:olfactory receptor 10AG1-like [Anolis sagrei ordinatus]